MGLRSQVETIPAAFIGSLKQLEAVVGDIREAKEGSRWRTLLEYDCQTAREFRTCWEGLQDKAQDCAAYLGEELDGPLAVPVEGAGEGRVDESTRTLVTQQREGLRAKVLRRALTLHQNQASLGLPTV